MFTAGAPPLCPKPTNEAKGERETITSAALAMFEGLGMG